MYQKSVYNYEPVAENLCNFDVNLFLAAPSEDRSRRVCTVMESEEITSTLCKLPGEATGKFFAFMFSLLDELATNKDVLDKKAECSNKHIVVDFL